MRYRTPIKGALGLGSAKDGVHHWWMQRLTAIALVPLVLWFSFSLISYAGADYEVVREWIASPLVAVLLIVLIASVFFHAQLGLQVVLEDYIHLDWLRIASIVLMKFATVLLALAGILAVLRIALGA